MGPGGQVRNVAGHDIRTVPCHLADDEPDLGELPDVKRPQARLPSGLKTGC
jgi:hypothetical protein